MKIIVCDDEPLMLGMLDDAIRKADASAEMYLFSNAKMVLDFAKNNRADVAFLDIQMAEMTGLVLARKLMELYKDINIVFVTGYSEMKQQSCAPFNDLFSLGYQSAAVGYCFGENSDHMPTPDIPDEETRAKMAEKGADIICKMVERMDMPHVVEQLQKLEAYGLENEEKYPWMPSAYNRKK